MARDDLFQRLPQDRGEIAAVQHGGAQILNFLPRLAERGFYLLAHSSNPGRGRFRTRANLLSQAIQLERNAGQALQ